MSDQTCFYCEQPATLLCDSRIESGTCDRPMCANCVAKQSPFIACSRGRGRKKQARTGTIDYCRECVQRRSERLRQVQQELTAGREDVEGQLSIFDVPELELPESELPTPQISAQTLNKNAIAFRQVKAAVYLRLILQLMQGERCSQQVRTHEISRLHRLREQALQELNELG